jgi:transcriptional regulator with XRE-family HTH domain
MKYLNVVGPQIRKLRFQRDWSQSQLAVKLQLKGWDLSRQGLAKIESKLHKVTDTELLYFSEIFQVPLLDLYPKIQTGKSRETLEGLLEAKPRPKLKS